MELRKNNHIYYPMLVDENDIYWDKIKKISEKNRNILLSAELPSLLMELQDSLKMPNEELAQLSIIIRQLFLGDFPKEQLETHIENLFRENDNRTIDSKKIISIVQFINNKILTIVPKKDSDEEPEESKENAVKIVSVSLEQALNDYPKIAYQEISNEGINLINFSVLVKPSIENWIADYRDKNGVGKHSPIERGNYLFHSENGKSLTPEERLRVGLILKSLDELTPLNIDVEKQMVVFGNVDNSNQVSSRLPGNDSRGFVSANKNETSGEPKDIFELKINKIGNTLPKKVESQPVSNPNPRLDLTPVRKAPSNLPTADTNSENSFSDKLQSGNAQNYFSAIYDQPKKDSPQQNGRLENMAKSEPKLRPSREEHFNIEKSSLRKQEAEEIVPEKPEVRFKNISFSPNFTPATKEKQSDASPAAPALSPKAAAVEKMEALETKEKLFSIPGSKPPIGTDHYDVEKAKVEEKIAAIASKSFPAEPKQELKLEANEEPKVEAKIQTYAPVSVTSPVNVSSQQPAKPATAQMETISKKINLDDLDSLSDEDLLRLYQEKKAANKPAGNAAKPQGFHIGPMNASGQSELPKINNVVNLKNN